MTIDEAKIAHKKLEDVITNLVIEFNRSTGMGVVSINLNQTKVYGLNGGISFIVDDVEVVVQL